MKVDYKYIVYIIRGVYFYWVVGERGEALSPCPVSSKIFVCSPKNFCINNFYSPYHTSCLSLSFLIPYNWLIVIFSFCCYSTSNSLNFLVIVLILILLFLFLSYSSWFYLLLDSTASPYFRLFIVKWVCLLVIYFEFTPL